MNTFLRLKYKTHRVVAISKHSVLSICRTALDDSDGMFEYVRRAQIPEKSMTKYFCCPSLDQVVASKFTIYYTMNIDMSRPDLEYPRESDITSLDDTRNIEYMISCMSVTKSLYYKLPNGFAISKSR